MPYCLYFNSTAKLQLLFEITTIFGDYFHGKVESPPSPVEELIARDKTLLGITWMKQGGEEEEHTISASSNSVCNAHEIQKFSLS